MKPNRTLFATAAALLAFIATAQQTTSLVPIEINGNTPGAQHDRLIVNGTVAIDGATLAGTTGGTAVLITIIANKRSNVPSFPAAVMAQAMMQQAGLNVQIEVLDYATQVDRRRSGNYQIISQSVAPRLDPALMYGFYVGNKDKNASLMWDDPKAVELMKAAYAESDQTKRQAIFDEFHTLMLKEMPGIFLYDMVDVWGATKKLKGQPVWQSNARLWEVSLDN